MRRFVGWVLVLVIVASIALHLQSKPVQVRCADVSGGVLMTSDGIDWSQRAGDLIRDWTTPSKPITTDDVTEFEHRLYFKVLRLWLRSFLLSGRGQTMDPEIIRVQRRAAKIRADAENQCTPCPTVAPPAPDEPTTPPAAPRTRKPGTDPRDTIVAASSGLSGADLAAAALTQAGFPDDQIAMGVEIARRESTFNPRAVNPTLRTVKGEWQIYYGVHPELLAGDPFDPYENARDAYQVWKVAGGSWSPWSTASAARAALTPGQQAPEGLGPDQPSTSPAPVTEGCRLPDGSSSADEGTVQAIASPATWGRLGNPHSASQAVAWLQRMDAADTPTAPGMCAAYVAEAYGWTGWDQVRSGITVHGMSGQASAAAIWSTMPAKYKHPGDTSPAAGMLLFWDIRSGRNAAYDHIAVADGHGGAYTTDAPMQGQIGHVSLATLNRWGTYLGAADPYFVARAGVPA